MVMFLLYVIKKKIQKITKFSSTVREGQGREGKMRKGWS
jgi:hypothetical protein